MRCAKISAGFSIWLLACADAKDDADANGVVTLTTSASTGSETSGRDGAEGSSTTGSTPEGSSSEAGSTTDEPVDFVAPTDMPAATQCDLWTQDCPDGEKCMPWSSDGGTWNATRCSPLDPDPKAPGDDCVVEGNDVSGIDDCEAGSMCFAVDPETLIGTCVAFCEGSAASPSCADPAQACNISNDGVLVLCLATCDPLLQDCPGGSWPHGCYPVNDEFLCWPDYSFDAGAYGAPCEFFNVCDVGLFCAIPEAVPGCNSNACCSQFCALDEPEACPDAAMGQECVAWYADGQAPPGGENLGFCSVMQ